MAPVAAAHGSLLRRAALDPTHELPQHDRTVKSLRGLTVQTYPEAVELFHQGVTLDEVFYIVSGVVKLVRGEGDGAETIVGLSLPGTWLGAASTIAHWPSPVTAVSSARVLLQRIPADMFRELLERDPELSRQVHRAHARELCRQASWIAELNSRSSRHRLERVIRQLIVSLDLRPSAGGVRLQLPLRQWEIAQLIAVTPEHLSRLLKEMDEEGVVRREKGWVVVPDVSRLDSTGDDGDIALWREGNRDSPA